MPAWSGFWNYTYGDGHRLIDSNNVRRTLGLRMNGYGRTAYNKVISQLVGGNVGGTALGQHTRVTHNPLDATTWGGKRTVEMKQYVNRATTAADITKIQKDLLYTNSPTFPRDKSGNGGGGKRGF